VIIQIHEIERQKSFIFGGDAYFTIENPATGCRFTYKVSKAEKAEDLFWVGLLTGPDNTSSYTFIGRITKDPLSGGWVFIHSPKKIGADAKSVQAFMWWFRNLTIGRFLNPINFYHCGRCCCCGRLLTTPESVQAGIGPVCAGRM